MYSATDYLGNILIFGECGRNAREAARVFPNIFRTELTLITESDDKDARDRSSSNQIERSVVARTVENEEAILNAVEDGTRSIEEIARSLCISCSTVQSFEK
jgi:DNA-binding NarL/FixJ family response regulator